MSNNQSLPTFSTASAIAWCLGYVVFMVLLQFIGVYLVSLSYFGADIAGEELLLQGSKHGIVVAYSVFFTASILSVFALVGLLLKTKSLLKIQQFLDIRLFNIKQFLLSIGLLAIFLLASEYTTQLLNKNPMEFMNGLIDQSSFWLMIIAVVIIAPIYEELIFRGVILGVLTHRQRSQKNHQAILNSTSQHIRASLISSFLFALVHFQYDFYGLTLIFIIALLFCYIKIRYGLLLAMLLHILNNGIAMFLYLLTNNYF